MRLFNSQGLLNPVQKAVLLVLIVFGAAELAHWQFGVAYEEMILFLVITMVVMFAYFAEKMDRSK